MAEEKRRRRHPKDESDPDRPRRANSDGPRRRSRTRLPAARLAQRARDQLSEITGLEPEGVTSLQRDDDGKWRVSVELLEVSRIPDALDVIGNYEVELDEVGQLLGYQRVRRYARGEKDVQTAGRGELT
jgi:Gas vesicle synthesis protein GvpO